MIEAFVIVMLCGGFPVSHMDQRYPTYKMCEAKREKVSNLKGIAGEFPQCRPQRFICLQVHVNSEGGKNAIYHQTSGHDSQPYSYGTSWPAVVRKDNISFAPRNGHR